MDEKLYKQLWELQNAFQDPRNQSEPNRWAETKQKIEAVLAKLKQEDIGVASTTTAVPQGKFPWLGCAHVAISMAVLNTQPLSCLSSV